MLDQCVIGFDIYASSIKYALLKCAPINEHLLASFAYTYMCISGEIISFPLKDMQIKKTYYFDKNSSILKIHDF